MAVRKETIKQQFGQALQRGVLEPGESLRGGFYCQTGPSPWWFGAIGVLIMLALGLRYYFIAVTDRRIVWMKASFFSARPKSLAWADPLGSAAISNVVANAKLWNVFTYQRPGQKQLRVNVNRYWADELRDALATMQGAVAPPNPAPAQAPPSIPPAPDL